MHVSVTLTTDSDTPLKDVTLRAIYTEEFTIGSTRKDWIVYWRWTECLDEQENSSFHFLLKVTSSHSERPMRAPPLLSAVSPRLPSKMSVSVWLNTNRFRLHRVECRPLSFSTPISFRRAILGCSGLSMFRLFLKPPGTSARRSCRPDVMSAVLVSLPARSFHLTPAWPGQ